MTMELHDGYPRKDVGRRRLKPLETGPLVKARGKGKGESSKAPSVLSKGKGKGESSKAPSGLSSKKGSENSSKSPSVLSSGKGKGKGESSESSSKGKGESSKSPSSYSKTSKKSSKKYSDDSPVEAPSGKPPVGPPSSGGDNDDQYDCIETGDDLVCSAKQDYNRDGNWITMTSDLTCPIDAVNESGLIGASTTPDTCECQSTLTKWEFYELGIIDTTGPIECVCYACSVDTPIGLRAGFGYQCDDPLFEECLSIDCEVLCEGEGDPLILPPFVPPPPLPPSLTMSPSPTEVGDPTRPTRPTTPTSPTTPTTPTPFPTTEVQTRAPSPPVAAPVFPPTDLSGAVQHNGIPNGGTATLVILLTTYFMRQMLR